MKEKKSNILMFLNTAWVYALLAMVGGVFYREFTKFNGFSGRTTLAFVHTHLFLLGMIFFLIAALFQFHVDVAGEKRFKRFYLIYNIGLAITVVMLIWRGITQVLGMELSKAVDASISGISGIGHICTGIGIILFFLMLKKLVREREKGGSKPC